MASVAVGSIIMASVAVGSIIMASVAVGSIIMASVAVAVGVGAAVGTSSSPQATAAMARATITTKSPRNLVFETFPNIYLVLLMDSDSVFTCDLPYGPFQFICALGPMDILGVSAVFTPSVSISPEAGTGCRTVPQDIEQHIIYEESRHICASSEWVVKW